MPNTHTTLNTINNINTNTLYHTIRSQRQTQQNQSRLYNRIMLAGYLHEQNCKKSSIDPQRMIKQSLIQYRNKLTGYLYIKGYFYIHILQSTAVQHINNYVQYFHSLISPNNKYGQSHNQKYGQSHNQKYLQSHKQLRVIYQGYQQEQALFKGYECDNSNQAAGPILIQTDKLQQQILQRSTEIYQFFYQGAKTKKSNPNHRIGNMILLNNDDMSLLISKQFMSIQQYIEMYFDQLSITKQSELSYPLPPNVFKMIEYIQIGQDYKMFAE